MRSRSLRGVVPGLCSIAVAAALGLYAKRGYQGPFAPWVHDSLGGVFYEILWCLVFGLCLPRAKAWRIAAGVLVATCILEFLQLWHPPFLEWLRSYFIGRSILGSWFDWSDFPYYFAGSALGWLWLRALGHDANFGRLSLAGRPHFVSK
jgi:hypothetical protein